MTEAGADDEEELQQRSNAESGNRKGSTNRFRLYPRAPRRMRVADAVAQYMRVPRGQGTQSRGIRWWHRMLLSLELPGLA